VALRSPGVMFLEKSQQRAHRYATCPSLPTTLPPWVPNRFGLCGPPAHGDYGDNVSALDVLAADFAALMLSADA
jgi:hypothetical protein